MTYPGVFIVLEGIEGVGKTTQMAYLTEYLSHYQLNSQLNFPLNLVRTREPGGTPLAESIRDITLQIRDEPLSPDAELLLMFASRAQHLAQVVLPALQKGDWVLSDRFIDATYAYQGGGRAISAEKIAILEHLVLGTLRPDLVIILDVPVAVGLARARARHMLDRFEQETLDFFERVRQTYLARAAMDPNRYFVVDANQSIEQVQQQLRQIIDPFLMARRMREKP